MKKLFLVLALCQILLISCDKIPQSDGLAAVDLGLSVKWASANVGAKSPSDYGNLFAWGETSAKAEYTGENYKWGYTKPSGSWGCSKYNAEDGLAELLAEDDVATQIMGSAWRMPTKSEMLELLATRNSDNYRWTFNKVKGHGGIEIKCLSNGNSIFLPFGGMKNYDTQDVSGAFGYYWSATQAEESASFLFITETSASCLNAARYSGYTVRPVQK